jgi:hypothetical protein
MTQVLIDKKKFTKVSIETEFEIIVCEFIPSKLVYWQNKKKRRPNRVANILCLKV